MALTTAEQTYLTSLYALRTKILSGTVVTDANERGYADPPSLPYVNREINRLENKSSVIAGGRRSQTTTKSDSYD